MQDNPDMKFRVDVHKELIKALRVLTDINKGPLSEPGKRSLGKDGFKYSELKQLINFPTTKQNKVLVPTGRFLNLLSGGQGVASMAGSAGGVGGGGGQGGQGGQGSAGAGGQGGQGSVGGGFQVGRA